jgi:hypothetical protein
MEGMDELACNERRHRNVSCRLADSHVVGLRDVLLDYAKPAGRQRVLLLLLALILLSLAVWALQILVHAHA